MRVCLIIGNADNFREDVNKALSLNQLFHHTIAVKRTIYQYEGRVDSFVSLHSGWTDNLLKQRFDAGFNMDFNTYIPPPGCNIPRTRLDYFGTKDVYVVPEKFGGSSGLYAIEIAIKLGFDRILLAGIPMDLRPRYDEKGEWAPAEIGVKRYRQFWVNNLNYFASKTRSMSGWTQKLLGAPDEHWFSNGKK